MQAKDMQADQLVHCILMTASSMSILHHSLRNQGLYLQVQIATTQLIKILTDVVKATNGRFHMQPVEVSQKAEKRPRPVQ